MGGAPGGSAELIVWYRARKAISLSYQSDRAYTKTSPLPHSGALFVTINRYLDTSRQVRTLNPLGNMFFSIPFVRDREEVKVVDRRIAILETQVLRA